MGELKRCPLCGSADVSPDCYSRDAEGVCTEPAVNCGGCGLIAIFDFEAKEPWDELTRRWNTRAIESAPTSDELVEALNDCVATLAAVRATAAGDDWPNAAEHFSAVCMESMKRARAAIASMPRIDEGGSR